MSRFSLSIIGVLVTASVSGAGARNPADAHSDAKGTQAAPPMLSSPDARKNPYRQLFVPRRDPNSVRAPHRPSTPSPSESREVCAMVVIPADPNVDPGMRVPIPDAAKSSAIRVVEPACLKK